MCRPLRPEGDVVGVEFSGDCVGIAGVVFIEETVGAGATGLDDVRAFRGISPTVFFTSTRDASGAT